MALFQRPWFGMANLLGLMLLLTIINNTKFAMLREPFFYPDFEYFTDAIKHPRLYLPFFGVRNAFMGEGRPMRRRWRLGCCLKRR